MKAPEEIARDLHQSDCDCPRPHGFTEPMGDKANCRDCLTAAIAGAIKAERERIALSLEARAVGLRKRTRPYDGGGCDMAADELEDFAESLEAPAPLVPKPWEPKP